MLSEIFERTPIQHLCEECTVKLTSIHKELLGTGFFITPRKIATCKHVFFHKGSSSFETFKIEGYDTIFKLRNNFTTHPILDIIVVDLGEELSQKCVNLKPSINKQGQKLWAWTYNITYPNGASIIPELKGLVNHHEIEVLRISRDLIIHGSSGTPILNMEDNCFLGVVYWVKERDQDALIIPAAYFKEYFRTDFQTNQKHHQNLVYWEKARQKSLGRKFKASRTLRTLKESTSKELDERLETEHPVPIRELEKKEALLKIDPLSPAFELRDFGNSGITLPYHGLGGIGLEKLCYQLLVCDGKTPRLFGRSGQSDFGVDIVVEEGDSRTLYQCKNLKSTPSFAQIKKAIWKFEEDWLNTAGLPTPSVYVYCCPHSLDDARTNSDFILFRENFRERTGIEIQFHDQAYFDAKLKQLPDIVSGLFGPIIAEHFCKVDGWRDELWTPITYSKVRHNVVERFIQRHEKGLIFISDDVWDWFTDAVSRSNVMMIRGLPGSGKTIVGLELITRLTQPFRRIYYYTLKESFDLKEMITATRRRASLPSFFILDDCHRRLKDVEVLLERLQPELRDPRNHITILLIGRYVTPEEGEETVHEHAFIEKLEEQGSCMNFTKGKVPTRQVLEHLKPDFRGLSKKRLEKINDLTGGDLLLLDEILQGIQDPWEIDDLTVDHLLKKVRMGYGMNGPSLPALQRLACLAQFDITPLVNYFKADWEESSEVANSLINELRTPRRYQFLHSSMASLIFRALIELDVGASEEAYIQLTNEILIDYFKFFERNLSAPGITVDLLIEDLISVIYENPTLLERESILEFKASFLTGEATIHFMTTYLHKISPHSLSTCLAISSKMNPENESIYASLLKVKFDDLMTGIPKQKEILPMFGKSLYYLRKYAPKTLSEIEAEKSVEDMLQLILEHGAINEYFNAVSNFSKAFSKKLLLTLDELMLDQLIQQTIDSGRSIGTLDLVMRELGRKENGAQLLRQLEEKIGASRFLELILANGTLFEFFKILGRATPNFSQKLLSVLDKPTADQLIEQTITSERSIGTLNLAMRELRRKNNGRQLLIQLEEKIGASRFLKFIVANGTLYELFMIVKETTPAFSQKFLLELNEFMVDQLIQQTIASGRSIGTLSLSMRELSRKENGGQLLRQLEEKIGASRFLKLILANGTLFELFTILAISTYAFSEELSSELNESMVDQLIKQTIASGRSIGTLGIAMRGLSRKENGGQLLEQLEEKIGTSQFLKLILANGTLFELFTVLAISTYAFSEELLLGLNESMVDQLIKQTIASGRSIGTLGIAMRGLSRKENGVQLLRQLEEKIGASRFLKLILVNGTLFELFKILENSTSAFSSELLSTIDEIMAGELLKKGIDKGNSMATIPFGLRALKKFPHEVSKFEQADLWWDMVKKNGTLNSIPDLRAAMRENFRSTFTAASASLTIADWGKLMQASYLSKIWQVYANVAVEYPKETLIAFQEAFKTNVTIAVANSDWRNLHQGSTSEYAIELIEKPEAKEFWKALHAKIKNVSISDLLNLPFLEAINAIALIWNEKQELRSELIGHFWEIMPPTNTWDDEKEHVAALWLLMKLARSEEFPSADVKKLLTLLREPWSAGTYKKIHTKPLFGYYWNLAALSFERGDTNSFKQILPKETKKILFDLLKKRVNLGKHLEEVLNLFSLAGLLFFLYPNEQAKIKRIIQDKIRSSRKVEHLINEATFIPAFFAWYGIAIIQGLNYTFTQMVNALLLAKAKDYKEKSPAIAFLQKKIKEFNAGKWKH